MFNKKILLQHAKEFVIFLIIFTILIMLGIWQIFRLEEKNNYIDKILNSAKHDPLTLNSSADFQEYKNILIKGEIDSSNILWLYRRHPMAKYKDGAYLVAPIITENGIRIIGVIGWFESRNFDKIKEEISQKKSIIASGLLIPGEKETIFIPKNDYAKKIIFTMNLESIMNYYELEKQNYFLAVTEIMNISDLNNDGAGYNSDSKIKNDIKTNFDVESLPITPKMMVKVRNDHAEYAVTWFCLAFFWLMMFYFYLKRSKK